MSQYFYPESIFFIFEMQDYFTHRQPNGDCRNIDPGTEPIYSELVYGRKKNSALATSGFSDGTEIDGTQKKKIVIQTSGWERGQRATSIMGVEGTKHCHRGSGVEVLQKTENNYWTNIGKVERFILSGEITQGKSFRPAFVISSRVRVCHFLSSCLEKVSACVAMTIQIVFFMSIPTPPFSSRNSFGSMHLILESRRHDVFRYSSVELSKTQ